MKKIIITLVISSLLTVVSHSIKAGSATWNLNPTSNDWNTAANWTPATVPNGPSDTATFGLSNITGVGISAATEVNTIAFGAGASPFTIGINAPAVLTIDAGGVVNNSGVTQNFVVAAGSQLIMQGSAGSADQVTYEIKAAPDPSTIMGYMALLSTNAGNATYILDGGDAGGGLGAFVQFHEASTCDNCNFVVNGGTAPFALAADLEFGGTDNFPSAGNGHYTINGGAAEGARGGFGDVEFGTTLATSTFTVNGGLVGHADPGALHLESSTTADQATLIAFGTSGLAGGQIHFHHDSLGGTSRVEVHGSGILDISDHDAPGVTIGSLTGDGLVSLSGNNLTVGAGGFDSQFDGTIHGASSSGGGSLTKVGSGTLLLTQSNTYFAGTQVKAGTLLVRNQTGSATGSGPVQVLGGTLAGHGIIAGTVTVGGSSQNAALSAGSSLKRPNTLMIRSLLTFNPGGSYRCGLISDSSIAAEVIAAGVTINGGALFSLFDAGTTALPAGTTFTVINNPSANPISGTFSNLPDGGTITSGANTFQANYEGGDGNDLTLTVVP
ncbi:MAG TPA: autotransporter-associated beta strand repeat-containing protein [Chthoniobacterales bacterium]|jgi:autotransporter-associated beta strand protein